MEEYQFPDVCDVSIPSLKVQEIFSSDAPSVYKSEAYFAKYRHDPDKYEDELKLLRRHVPSNKSSRRYYIKSMKLEAAPPLRPITKTEDGKRNDQISAETSRKSKAKSKFVNVAMNYERAATALQEKMHQYVEAKQFPMCIKVRDEQAKLKKFKDEFDSGNTSNLQEFRDILKRILVSVDLPRMAAEPQHFTLVTWNVWKGEFEQLRRWEVIIKTVAKLQPHAICFQEVSVPFIEMLDKHSMPGGLLEHYGDVHRSDDRIDEDFTSGGRDYGVLLLTHKGLGEPYRGRTALKSKFNRWLETASWKIRDTQLTIACVHLESSKPLAEYRVRQLGTIFEDLEKWDFTTDNSTVLFCGDFNFSPQMEPEQTRLEKERNFLDVWTVLHKDLPGYTEDTDINLMRYIQSNNRRKQVRYDRIMLHSPKQHLAARSLKRLGMEPLEGETEVFPSDHFGLVGSFAVKWDR